MKINNGNTSRKYFLNTSQAVIFYEFNKLHWYTRRYHWYTDKHVVLFDELFSVLDSTDCIDENCLFAQIDKEFNLNSGLKLHKYIFEYNETARNMYGVVMEIPESKANVFASLIQLLY